MACRQYRFPRQHPFSGSPSSENLATAALHSIAAGHAQHTQTTVSAQTASSWRPFVRVTPLFRGFHQSSTQIHLSCCGDEIPCPCPRLRWHVRQCLFKPNQAQAFLVHYGYGSLVHWAVGSACTPNHVRQSIEIVMRRNRLIPETSSATLTLPSTSLASDLHIRTAVAYL